MFPLFSRLLLPHRHFSQTKSKTYATPGLVERFFSCLFFDHLISQNLPATFPTTHVSLLFAIYCLVFFWKKCNNMKFSFAFRLFRTISICFGWAIFSAIPLVSVCLDSFGSYIFISVLCVPSFFFSHSSFRSLLLFLCHSLSLSSSVSCLFFRFNSFLCFYYNIQCTY